MVVNYGTDQCNYSIKILVREEKSGKALPALPLPTALWITNNTSTSPNNNSGQEA